MTIAFSVGGDGFTYSAEAHLARLNMQPQHQTQRATAQLVLMTGIASRA
jgi:hypothetical protein